jgi:hypothetical protein
MIEKFSIKAAVWSRRFGIRHWNFLAQSLISSLLVYDLSRRKLPSREGLGVCFISCKLTVDSLQCFLDYMLIQKSYINTRYPRALLELAKQSNPCIRG